MIITYNPTPGAHTRTYRQELRIALRPMGAGITLMLNAKLKPGSVVLHLDRDRWDTPDTVSEVKRLVLRHFLTAQQNVTIA